MRRKTRKGSALLEFALGFTILTPLVVGAMQYGIGFVQLQQLQAAARAGAHYGSQLGYESRTETPTDEFRWSVENMVLYGKAEEGEQPVVAGLQREHVRIEMGMEAGVPREVRVSITGFGMALPGGRRAVEGKLGSSYPYRGRL